MSDHLEYIEKSRALRADPMVNAWIAEYQKDKWSRHKNCTQCGWPHNEYMMCFSATFGEIILGRERYSIAENNLVFFHGFMTNLGKDWGFHWRDETFFKREADGSVTVRFVEQFNNSPQVKSWNIPPAEWASIVCSVSAAGETGERWDAAQVFHGRLP